MDDNEELHLNYPPQCSIFCTCSIRLCVNMYMPGSVLGGFGLTHVKRENALLFPFCYLSLINALLYRRWQAEGVNIKNTNLHMLKIPLFTVLVFALRHTVLRWSSLAHNYVNNIFVKFCVAGRWSPSRCAVSSTVCTVSGVGKFALGDDFFIWFFVQEQIIIQVFQSCLKVKYYFLVLYIIYDLTEA